MGSVTTEISPWTLLIPILITGFGVGFIFVPISTQAYGTLPREQIGAASGLYNLMRNIGGSIGISLTATLLTRRSSAHQSELTNYNPRSGQQFQSALQTEMGALGTHFGPAHAQYPAELHLYHQLLYQATDWAFVDVFRWLALLCLSGAGIVWLALQARTEGTPAGRRRSALTETGQERFRGLLASEAGLTVTYPSALSRTANRFAWRAPSQSSAPDVDAGKHRGNSPTGDSVLG